MRGIRRSRGISASLRAYNASHEANDVRICPHVAPPDGPGELQSSERTHPAERDISLTRRKCSGAEIDPDIVQRQALAFVDGRCPPQNTWDLRVAAGSSQTPEDFAMEAALAVSLARLSTTMGATNSDPGQAGRTTPQPCQKLKAHIGAGTT